MTTAIISAPVSSSIRALSARTIHFPVRIPSPRLQQQVLGVARDLEAGRSREARARVEDLLQLPAPAAGGDVTTKISSTHRARALAATMFDLATSGWQVSVEDGQVYLSAPEPPAAVVDSTAAMVREKQRVRGAMSARVTEHLLLHNTRLFVSRLERGRPTQHGPRGVQSLLASGEALARSLREQGAQAIRPVVQRALAEDGVDPATGLPLWDIFRYFRYTWSFPVGSAPGRTLPFLIRDEGQPGAPVCGLLALASPVPKLGVRDAALGWTPAWLEAVVRALGFAPSDPAPALHHVEQEVRRRGADLEHGTVFSGLSALLRVTECADARSLSAALKRLPEPERARRADAASRRLLSSLRHSVRASLRLISFKGLGLKHGTALAEPPAAVARLERLSARATQEWKDSRTVSAGVVRADRHKEVEGAHAEAAAEPLFRKKRAFQAARLLRAWQEIMPQPRERPALRLRQLALGSDDCLGRFLAGANVCMGLRTALLQRQGALLASQVAEVAICGAIAPYGPLLGGKLAALTALSREVASAYHQRYARSESIIASQMAGRSVRRSADLVALCTTSFYAVGSAQYERLKLPPQLGGLAWRYAGLSRGTGTLHFSRETSEALQQLVEVETGQRLISGRFGEGPSERMRKIREGLARLGMDANELLSHGMSRRVYVAKLVPAATIPGAHPAKEPARCAAPTVAEVTAFWRDRWLAPRLLRSPELIANVASFDPAEVLLSTRVKDALTRAEGPR